MLLCATLRLKRYRVKTVLVLMTVAEVAELDATVVAEVDEKEGLLRALAGDDDVVLVQGRLYTAVERHQWPKMPVMLVTVVVAVNEAVVVAEDVTVAMAVAEDVEERRADDDVVLVGGPYVMDYPPFDSKPT
uniref:Uncharacterized protein n=1 Tax=Phytophthora ramorum TaxID=164328 RepID=H3H750_PHYRM